MNLIPTAVKQFTFDQFCSFVPDGQKADLIEGMIYMASPDNWEAASLFGLLFKVKP